MFTQGSASKRLQGGMATAGRGWASGHRVYSYPGVAELIDLQPDKKDHSKAKKYQVRQVRKFIEKYLEVYKV